MSLVSFHKSLLPMTLRQRLRYLFLVYKKIRQQTAATAATPTIAGAHAAGPSRAAAPDQGRLRLRDRARDGDPLAAT
jgi:hypothetical protein